MDKMINSILFESMLKKTLLILFTIVAGCYKKPVENPKDIAKSFCSCLESQLSNAKDSSITPNDCSIEAYGKSRLMNIYIDFDNWDKYDSKTLDSAQKFALEVRNIEDTLCYNKRGIKKITHFR